MYHQPLEAVEVASLGTILAIRAEMAAALLLSFLPEERELAEAFDNHYGRGKWFLLWDEDLAGKPIRGTITMACGKDRLVVG